MNAIRSRITPQELQDKQQTYLKAINPIINELIKLRVFAKIIVYPDGTIEESYPERVKELIVNYEKLMDFYKNKIFGTAQ